MFAKRARGEPSYALPVQPAQTVLDRAIDPHWQEHPGQTGMVLLQDNSGRIHDTGLFRGVEMMLRIFSVNRRMHNKAWIADGRVAVVGGRNIGDEYFEASANTNFFDIDLLISGEAVAETSYIFDLKEIAKNIAFYTKVENSQTMTDVARGYRLFRAQTTRRPTKKHRFKVQKHQAITQMHNQFVATAAICLNRCIADIARVGVAIHFKNISSA